MINSSYDAIKCTVSWNNVNNTFGLKCWVTGNSLTQYLPIICLLLTLNKLDLEDKRIYIEYPLDKVIVPIRAEGGLLLDHCTKKRGLCSMKRGLCSMKKGFVFHEEGSVFHEKGCVL